MTNRRDLLKIGLAAAALPVAAQAAFIDTGVPRVPLYKVLYDTRFPASVAFARRAAVGGLAVHAMAGDMTRVLVRRSLSSLAARTCGDRRAHGVRRSVLPRAARVGSAHARRLSRRARAGARRLRRAPVRRCRRVAVRRGRCGGELRMGGRVGRRRREVSASPVVRRTATAVTADDGMTTFRTVVLLGHRAGCACIGHVDDR